MKSFTIGELAEACFIKADTLRYYERIGLLAPSGRSPGGYRVYDQEALNTLRFILGAKALTFTLDEIKELLRLRNTKGAGCEEILRQTQGKIAQAERRIEELKEVRKVLLGLAADCPGDSSPLSCCPILSHLQNAATKAPVLILTMLLVGASPAQAKPLSYVGGTMIMTENDETGHTATIDYTITPKVAAGVYVKKEEGGDDFYIGGPQVNTLIKRWNLPGAQGNIFNMTGIGAAHDDDEGTNLAAWTSFLADYETRRVFVSYEAKAQYAGDIDTSFSQRARVGVAPYLGNYEDLNTWLMVQVDHHPKKDDTVVITPLVRFYYKTILVEAGYSSNDHLMFNWNLQF